MRREWDIWSKILAPDNCRKAVKREAQTARCHRNGFSVDLREREDYWTEYVRQRIGDGLRLGPFVEFDTWESGKLRHVRCYTPTDAMCVRACVQIMEPRVYARMSPRSYCPVPGRGGLKLARDFRALLRKAENKCRVWNKYHPNARTKWRVWIGQFDERKYYDSLTYNIMRDAMGRVFGEPEVLNLVEVFLGQRDGLPIGAGYSAMIANLVLAPLDWEIVGMDGVYGYARHLDNACYLTKSKKIAGEVRKTVEDWNAQHGLAAHEWAKFPAGHHAVESGGWRIDAGRILPSSNVTRHVLKLLGGDVMALPFKQKLALASLYGYVKHGESMSLKRLWMKRKAWRIFAEIGATAREAASGPLVTDETPKGEKP